jgi:hypothetical protein
MPPILSSGDTNVADDAANPPASDEDTSAFPPDFIELVEKRFIIQDLP